MGSCPFPRCYSRDVGTAASGVHTGSVLGLGSKKPGRKPKEILGHPCAWGTPLSHDHSVPMACPVPTAALVPMAISYPMAIPPYGHPHPHGQPCPHATLCPHIQPCHGHPAGIPGHPASSPAHSLAARALCQPPGPHAAHGTLRVSPLHAAQPPQRLLNMGLSSGKH